MEKVISITLMGLTLVGCVKASKVVQTRASNEYNCPKESVVVEDLGGAAYRVQACGNTVTYVCRSSGGANEAQVTPCIKESEAKPETFE